MKSTHTQSMNSVATTLDTDAIVQESVFHEHDTGTIANIEEFGIPAYRYWLKDTSASPSAKTSVTAPTHPNPATSTASLSLMLMQLSESHVDGRPGDAVAAVSLAPLQPNPALVLHPFLIKELAADFPAVQTTAVSAVITAPHAADSGRSLCHG